MASAFLLLLPLALKSPWPIELPRPADGPADEAVAPNVAVVDRAATGYSWTVELPDGGRLLVEAPVAVVETVLPLPLRLSTTGSDAVTVAVCESDECLLPRSVRVEPGQVTQVDALFTGRAPRLRFDVVDAYGNRSERQCCDRALSPGRAVAFAGGDEHAFAFASLAGDSYGLYGAGLFTVDVGTFLAERPDLLAGFGAVIVDDGWAPPAMAAPLRRFVGNGGILSMRADDAAALGLVAEGARRERIELANLPTTPAYGAGAARIDGDRVAMRLADRVVQLGWAPDHVVVVGAGRLILRTGGRSEDQRLSQIAIVQPGFHGAPVQLDARQLPVVAVAGAGLASPGFGLIGFGVAIAFISAIGVVLWRSLQRASSSSSPSSSSSKPRGPVVAARRTVAVGVVGAAALLGLRVFCTADVEVRLAHWGPGDGNRRAVQAFARAPGSFGDVDLAGAPWRGPPTVVTLVGRSSYRNTVSAEGGRLHAALSSASGLVGLWIDNDATAGALRAMPGGRFENTLPFALDWVLLADQPGGQLNVVPHVAAGASFSLADAVSPTTFGSVLEERFARDVRAVACQPVGGDWLERDLCAVGIATHDGVLIAVEVTR